ncbi:hypothetical protein N431DRAFT_524396 [Stipitochalara longipes BDJ]|nr:hypothetical protein N431DRAFT_524396 [Stipitochalara longipes BDJ]
MENQTSDETRAAKKAKYNKEKKERARKRKAEEKEKEKEGAAAAAPAEKSNALLESKYPPKQLRRDWAAMKASLIYDERGVGSTPDGDWMYFPAAGPASEKALPASHRDERARWMFLGFVEEGENAREMLPSSDEEGEGEGEKREGEKEEHTEMGGMGVGDSLEGGVAGMALE